MGSQAAFCISSCATFGKLNDLSGLQFCHLKNEPKNGLCFPQMVKVNELICDRRSQSALVGSEGCRWDGGKKNTNEVFFLNINRIRLIAINRIFVRVR